MRLTEHFDLSEFTDSQTAARMGIANVPSDAIIENLVRLAETLEDVRKILGKPILISSGYRCEALNKAVGGSLTSAHMTGRAADFICPGFGNPYNVCKTLSPKMESLGIDQLIYEFQSWVHLGIAPLEVEPRHMALTIDRAGTRSGIA